jgi:parallel beta-helix repeat protein
LLQLSSNTTLNGNRVEANGAGMGGEGIYVWGGNNNNIVFNNIVANTTRGLWIDSSSNNSVFFNNFISNSTVQAQVTGMTMGNSFSYLGQIGNYWDNFDSRIAPENCVNIMPFDEVCDGNYSFTGGVDTGPLVLRDWWDRYDWTWYDDVGGDNWVLLANRPGNSRNMLFNLSINNMTMALASLPGYSPGYVPPGKVIYNKYAGLMGGPVTALNHDLTEPAITSQRVLWPKGGDSLEEVNGVKAQGLDSRFYWTWYDMASPGFKNWVLVSNPNSYQINYNVRIAGTVVDTGIIPAGGRVTPSFPGVIGGPVEVNAWNSFGDPVYIMASQRVLSNGDMAFNEVPGQPASQLTDNHVWTWYDMTGGAQNWVLVANPPGAAPIYYEIWIAGTKVRDGGPIPAGGNETPTFPDMIGGPVEVKSFTNPGHTIAANSIASQRSLWGPSFEEVPGADSAALLPSYFWTWYDEKSAGARNWVLVANPSATDTITATISFPDAATGTPVNSTMDIPPGGRWTPTFAGLMGGPVSVSAVQQGTTNARVVIASQRVLWNGYFNEVWGQ